MKNILILFVCVFIAGTCFAQDFEYEEERKLAKAIFNSLQEADLEKFSSYCISEERLTKMLSNMGEKTEKEKGIKSELSGIEPSKMLSEAKEGFKKALELVKSDSTNLKECNFPELGDYKIKFKVTNLKCMKIKYYLCPENKYLISIYLFKTADDLFIYNFRLTKGGMI